MLGIRLVILFAGLLIYPPLLWVWLILTILPHVMPQKVVYVERQHQRSVSGYDEPPDPRWW